MTGADRPELGWQVFGAQSAGEVAAGLSFHGEAGLTCWEVTEADREAGSLTMVAEAPDAVLADRAMWLGITMNIAGVISFLLSWLAPDLSGIWCRSPRFPSKI